MKKKLLFIHGPLGGGGAERVLIDILSNIDYSKFEVDLCLIVNKGILLSELPKQIKILPLWEKYTLYYKVAYRFSVWFGNNWMFRRVLKTKITKQYDTEISFLEGMPLKLHAMMETKAKKITWVHCDLFNFPYVANQFAKGEELAAYNKMDTVVCVSNDSFLAFNKRFPGCTTSKKVIYNPLDIKKIKDLANEVQERHEKVFTVVIVGRLTPQKKMDRVMRLAARFKKENGKIKFQIVGDGELKEELLALQNNLGVQDMVEFTGFIRNPYSYINNADLLLSCSGYEGFGLVICEAMCLGVPVVSTKTAGPTEIIDNNKYGLLCEHDDESIFNAVKRMFDDSDLRKHYSEKGKIRAYDFDINKIIKSFESLLTE